MYTNLEHSNEIPQWLWNFFKNDLLFKNCQIIFFFKQNEHYALRFSPSIFLFLLHFLITKQSNFLQLGHIHLQKVFFITYSNTQICLSATFQETKDSIEEIWMKDSINNDLGSDAIKQNH